MDYYKTLMSITDNKVEKEQYMKLLIKNKDEISLLCQEKKEIQFILKCLKDRVWNKFQKMFKEIEVYDWCNKNISFSIYVTDWYQSGKNLHPHSIFLNEAHYDHCQEVLFYHK